MNIKIYDQELQEEVEAEIISADKFNGELPSIHNEWRFNFKKHSKRSNAKTYVIIGKHSKDIIEGCLIFEMREKTEPYMAYIEIAPHNKSSNKKYDYVAGCLIAYACRLSFIHGKDDFQGWLAFDVYEENPLNQNKLMTLYSTKYKAQRLQNTSLMYISPEDGEKLIKQYLDK
ncbi:hypothetical protein [Sphingobacterium composti Ten et al. 2007 non Yoo et al. 2007]|uniref:hypothetical protein n=1 Tax=Sphingobacterium composti TaxID=363260 RepID=UPI0013576381|nr:hypothetical protein [Sphingobacterium composti Ten et al. 2007 non Yoo et al. 2007]